MRLLDFLTESQTIYGWITSEGKFLSGSHEIIVSEYFADDILRDHGPLQKGQSVYDLVEAEHYGYAFKAGWIRVSSSNREVAFEVSRNTTKNALRGMKRLIKDIVDGRLIGIQLNNTYDEFPDARRALRWLNQMRRQIVRESTLMEMEIPETDYGYWITDRGRMIPVPAEAHGAVAARHLGIDYSHLTYDHTITTAYERGWIRIVDQQKYTVRAGGNLEHVIHISVEDPKKLTREALNTVLGYLAQTDATTIYLDVYDPHTSLNFTKPHRPEKAEVMQFFKKLFFSTSRRNVAEAVDIPGTYYGYWITHTGEYLQVDDEAHHWTAQQWFEQNPHEGNTRELGVFETAYKKGWIRIIDPNDPNDYVHVSILDPRDVAPAAARAILPFIRGVDDRRDPHTIIFDIGRGFKLPPWGSYPTKNQLYQYFRELYKANRQRGKAA